MAAPRGATGVSPAHAGIGRCRTRRRHPVTGFPRARGDRSAPATGRLRGMVWRGRTLRSSDRLTPAETHYLYHVVKREEWPVGTTLDGYLESLRQVARDPDSAVFLNRYGIRGLQVGVIRASRELRGPGGQDYVLVEYRVDLGNWVTGHQLSWENFMQNPQRRDFRWLRPPR